MRPLVDILSGVLAVVLLSGFTASPQEAKDWDEYGLRGAVKSIRTVYYEPREVEGGAIVESDGREAVFPDGSAELFVRFDCEGRIVENSRLGIDGKLIVQILNIYDGLGNCVEESAYNSDGLMWQYFTVLDENRRIMRRERQEAGGKVAEQTIYKYDSRGHIAMEEISSHSGKLVHTREYRYNRGGKVVRERVSVNSEGWPEEWKEVSYTYYPKSDLVKKEVWSHSSGVKEVNRYLYDSSGNVLVSRKYDGKNTLTDEWKYSYDEYGNEIQKIGADYTIPWRATWNSVYEYDISGNWSKKIIYCTDGNGNTAPQIVIERVIEYCE